MSPVRIRPLGGSVGWLLGDDRCLRRAVSWPHHPVERTRALSPSSRGSSRSCATPRFCRLIAQCDQMSYLPALGPRRFRPAAPACQLRSVCSYHQRCRPSLPSGGGRVPRHTYDTTVRRVTPSSSAAAVESSLRPRPFPTMLNHATSSAGAHVVLTWGSVQQAGHDTVDASTALAGCLPTPTSCSARSTRTAPFTRQHVTGWRWPSTAPSGSAFPGNRCRRSSGIATHRRALATSLSPAQA